MKTLLNSLTSITLTLTLMTTSCDSNTTPEDQKNNLPDQPENSQTITLGGGCYWCIEAVYQQLDGVHSATSGFMGGHIPDPTYEEVTTGHTGHVEVVQVTYNPQKISTEKIIDWFWKAHDPTQGNGQGEDIGPQYRPVIFYHTNEQKKLAETSKKELQTKTPQPIATSIEKAKSFYKAKESHQDYYRLNKNKNPYCRAVIVPKLDKLNLKK